MSKVLQLRMADLPKPIEIIGECGRRKLYKLVPAGKLGACLNKENEPVEDRKPQR